jgi:hypothetical protein
MSWDFMRTRKVKAARVAASGAASRASATSPASASSNPDLIYPEPQA